MSTRASATVNAPRMRQTPTQATMPTSEYMTIVGICDGSATAFAMAMTAIVETPTTK